MFVENAVKRSTTIIPGKAPGVSLLAKEEAFGTSSMSSAGGEFSSTPRAEVLVLPKKSSPRKPSSAPKSKPKTPGKKKMEYRPLRYRDDPRWTESDYSISDTELATRKVAATNKQAQLGYEDMVKSTELEVIKKSEVEDIITSSRTGTSEEDYPTPGATRTAEPAGSAIPNPLAILEGRLGHERAQEVLGKAVDAVLQEMAESFQEKNFSLDDLAELATAALLDAAVKQLEGPPVVKLDKFGGKVGEKPWLAGKKARAPRAGSLKKFDLTNSSGVESPCATLFI